MEPATLEALDCASSLELLHLSTVIKRLMSDPACFVEIRLYQRGASAIGRARRGSRGGWGRKSLTKNGASYVAIVDARKLDCYHALEEEHACLVLLDDAEGGLRQVLEGQAGTEDELKRLLAD